MKLKGITKCSYMVTNSLPQTPPPPTLRLGSKGPNSSYPENGHVTYQIKWNHKVQQHGTNILPAHPLPMTLRVKWSKFILPEWWYVACQIKGNHECSNMITNILPADPHPHPTLGLWQTIFYHVAAFRYSLLFHMQHDHVLKKLKFDLLTPSPKNVEVGCGVCGQNVVYHVASYRSKVNFFRKWSRCISR